MSLLNTIAILGRQPELGLAELESSFGASRVEPFGRSAALVSEQPNIDHLGGVVKLGRVLYDGPATSLQSLPVDVAQLPVRETKTPFAISVYGIKATTAFVVAAGLALKKGLKLRGTMRFVAPAEGLTVTAAQLKHNRILELGFELLVAVAGQRMIVAKTIGVQNIDWYSQRDYDRPVRSAEVGMLPPKLAQILVNATKGAVVVDPFCGTGVVMQEALLVGRDVAGSDLASEMVTATRANLAWLAEVTPAPLPAWRVDEAIDAREVRLPERAAVVSEGYLGPNLTHSPAASQLLAIKRELLDLYRASLANFAGQQSAGDEVSICVPAWRVNGAWDYLGIVDELPRLGYTLKGFKHARTPLLYARGDQVVGRQLLLLRKK